MGEWQQGIGTRTTVGKALDINLDSKKYGAFAEIGAGQEVARYFFQAGRASHTIAKTISAYDMVYSDEIYGKEKSGRYVCESRVQKMLEKEFSLLIRRLDSVRGKDSEFFALANTVATSSAGGHKAAAHLERESHGWMGFRFQDTPQAEPSEITIHLRMLDRNRLQQQECLGILGVNLMHSSYYRRGSESEFLSYLMDNLKNDQVAIDFIRVSGPAFKNIKMRELNLELVLRGMTTVSLFEPEGSTSYFADRIFNRRLLVQRGSFRPVTNTHLKVLEKGIEHINKLEGNAKSKNDIMSFMELIVPQGFNSQNLTELQDIKSRFINRMKLINELGYTALVSNCTYYYQLKRFCRRFTAQQIYFVLSATHLEKLFEESFYDHLEGGILEGLGKLLDSDVSVLIYPHKTDLVCKTAQTIHFDEPLHNVYKFFAHKKQIVDISGCDEIDRFYHSIDAWNAIEAGGAAWKELVPQPVQALVNQLKDEM